MGDFRKKTVRDVELAGKKILMRVDYNVPMADGKITEDMRIQASLPTIQYLTESGAERVVLISHLGRPEGEVKPEFSLAAVAERLGELLGGQNVMFVPSLDETEIRHAVESAPSGAVILLENLRFSAEEEKNSEEFAKRIIEATGSELFVQDGFAVIHRAHASTAAMARELPSVAGFLVEREVSALEGAIRNPERPVVVIIGGAKVADKQPLIDQFLPIADRILVGGKIAADGYVASDDKIYVAEDFVENSEGAKLDIGPKSVARMLELLKDAKTVVWNGDLGKVEEPEFEAGTRAVAEALGKARETDVIIGGGDTASYINALVAQEPELEFKLISTGGGASLELLSGLRLPGFEVLESR